MTEPTHPPQQNQEGKAVTPDEVAKLADLAGIASRVREDLEGLDSRCEEHRKRQRAIYLQLAYLKFAHGFRQITQNCFSWRIAAPVIAGVALGAVVFTAYVSWPMGLLGFLLGASLPVGPLYVPGSEALARHLRRLSDQSATIRAELSDAPRARQQLKNDIETASASHLELKRSMERKLYLASTEYRREQLLTRDWKALRGAAFEEFLVEVFRELGYSVETTKTSGDQGADLIVGLEAGRFAIQAKGDEENVEKSAVQEAHAAGSFYGCQASVVVTNSRFTREARELAERVGCGLVDERVLPALVLGRVNLRTLCGQ